MSNQLTARLAGEPQLRSLPGAENPCGHIPIADDDKARSPRNTPGPGTKLTRQGTAGRLKEQVLSRGHFIALGPAEHDLLRTLADLTVRTYTRSELMRSVWGQDEDQHHTRASERSDYRPPR